MTTVYLAGGMRTGWQKKFIERYPELDFIDPCTSGLKDPKDYTKWDMKAVEKSDAVIAYLEEGNPSGLGLAFEIGYALGLGKRLVYFINEKRDKYAAILEEAVWLKFYTLEEIFDHFDTLVGREE
jgi:nucleoside 2-deoxyribosyltransferase